MKGFLAIFRRELAGLFLAPLAWVLLVLVTLYQAYWFLLLLDIKGGEVNAALGLVLGGGSPAWGLMGILPPLLTMRMISEESRSGLLEFLLTAPVSDAAVIAGKALAATAFMVLVWTVTLGYGLAVQGLGATPDWGHLVAQWAGMSLASALFCALGIVASALFSTPLLAAFIGILVNLALLAGVPVLMGSVRGTLGQWLEFAFEHVNVYGHFTGSFLVGALDSAHVLFFVAWTAALLFLAVRIVESRRWLG